jgi:dTDP-4-dehydrorhamnose reductase
LISLEFDHTHSDAIKINTDFPIYLNSLAKVYDFRLIQIGTDCVFSGSQGSYSENSHHSPNDLYGETKSQGERTGANSLILRTSIVGPEIESTNSLIGWFLSLPLDSIIDGYTNHIWNGVSTYHFAKLVLGIICSNEFKGGLFHVVPSDTCSKYELLEYFRTAFNRKDIVIRPREAEDFINRTLSTEYPQCNRELWMKSGYNEPPSIKKMIEELSTWMLREMGTNENRK